VELDTDGKVFDCGLVDPGCHVSNWFADFVVSGLNPALGWLAAKAFHTPEPTAGMRALHEGILGTSNVLFVLVIVAGGLVAMCYQTVQSRYSAADILPRAVFAFVASNFSLWVSTEMVAASNDIAAAIGAQGIDSYEAAVNLRDRMDVILQEALVFSILLLVVVVVLLVVWMITEAVRICMVIVLVIGAPLLLMFHAVPHTNRIAELWWRAMAGLCAIPIAQSVVFIAMARLFLEGQMRIFGSVQADAAPALVVDTGSGSEQPISLASAVSAAPTEPQVGDADWLMQIMLLLVLLYVQIRISSWVMRLVWQPNPGTSPIAAMLKNLGWMLAFRSIGNVRMPRSPATALRWQFSREKTPGRKLPRYKPTPANGLQPLQPLQPQAWWYRARHDPPEPAGALTAGGPRTLPGPGSQGPWPGPPRPGRPPALPGQRALSPVPEARPGSPVPPRRALEEGRMPGSPRTGQQVLFPRPTPPPPSPGASGRFAKPGGSGVAMPPQRRWRQGVLPTPPPVRVPGRKAPERVGLPDRTPRPSAGLRHLPTMPAVSWGKPPHVKGQGALFPSPRRTWKQYGLFPRPDQK
jgi:hypothetical protein